MEDRRILNDESLREICQNVFELAKQSRREKQYLRYQSLRYLRLRLSLKQKLEEFLQKFLDVETALNDQHN